MHQHDIEHWQHSHNYSGANERGERRTLYVLILTAVTMVVEIIAGTAFGSMALLADGWHMGTHVAAFMITLFAYRYARKHAHSPAYTFGTGKVSVLGGFSSAVALAVVSLMMIVESVQRLVSPEAIQFNDAIAVAVLGLAVNIVSAFLLKDDHHHDHGHGHTHDHHHAHTHDHNLQAAYMHVLADALTSVLAIAALTLGKTLGWHWLDPVMGIVGAIIIARWAYGLVKQTGPILLDASIDQNVKSEIKQAIENDADNQVSDIHVWKVDASHYAAIISLVTHSPNSVDYYKSLLRDFHHLSHVTIEVNTCDDERCIAAAGDISR